MHIYGFRYAECTFGFVGTANVYLPKPRLREDTIKDTYRTYKKKSDTTRTYLHDIDQSPLIF
jgi:hypothetical protein